MSGQDFEGLSDQYAFCALFNKIVPYYVATGKSISHVFFALCVRQFLDVDTIKPLRFHYL